MKLPADLFEPPPWHALAGCRASNVDPEWFFPDNYMQDRPALNVCFNKCPVRMECLTEGFKIRSGIYGGVPEGMRRRWKGTIRELYEVSLAKAQERRIVRGAA
jgi:hypothetical protein